jgi:non-heme chloroperoxidase
MPTAPSTSSPTDTATITDHEARQIERANATGLQPVVFVHGLWLLPSSWDRWSALFEKAGYTALAPGWPDDPETVEQANANPEVFAHKTVGQVADHFAEIIGRLDRKPAILGHSFGGLLVPLVVDSGWREVADTALAFVERFASPQA